MNKPIAPHFNRRALTGRTPPDGKQMLTERQQAVYDFLVVFIAEHGYPPTNREIMVRFGFSSVTAVVAHFRALRRKGWIETDVSVARGIRLLGDRPVRVQAAQEVIELRLVATIERLKRLRNDFAKACDSSGVPGWVRAIVDAGTAEAIREAKGQQ